MKIEDKLYSLKLGENVIIEDHNLFTTALRVPGGWIMRSYDKSANIMAAVFVPLDYEFKPMPVGEF